jgi:hypothetical protein
LADRVDNAGKFMPQLRGELGHTLAVKETFHIGSADRAGFNFYHDAPLGAGWHFHLDDFYNARFAKNGFSHFLLPP